MSESRFLIPGFLAVFAACGGGPTQPTVVVHTAGEMCTDVPPAGQDVYESVAAKARCDHPDMVANPDGYAVRRIPSRGAARFVIDDKKTGTSFCCYEVDATTGMVSLRN